MDIHKQHPALSAQAPASRVYAWYCVFALMLCQALASVDARLPFILVEALKRDLGLSDTQVGLITGPAFSLTYAVCAIPIAKLSDRGNRVAIISVAIAVWSAFTAVAGLAVNFGTFAATRVGVAVGESALTPGAHSLIASYFKGPARAKGLAVYSFGLAAGAFIAFAVGGYVGDRFGWRMAFFLVGGGGLGLVALLMGTVRHPPRESAVGASSAPRGDIRSLLRHPVIRNLVLGGTLLGFSAGSVNAWGPAYVMRTFHLSATETGASYGAVTGLLAMVGILAGGFIGSWLSERHPSRALQMLSGAFVIAMLAQIGGLLADDYTLFLALLALTILLSSFYLAPTHAAIQSIVDPASRSFASAVTLFCINGLGIALGAFVVGALSDVLTPRLGDGALRWALLGVSLAKSWSALHYWLASRHLLRSSST